MSFTKLALAAAIVAASGAMAFAPTVNAADTGTITITGKVLSSTCSVSGNGGSSDFTVTLPPVAATALDKAGKVAGTTAFKLTLTGCPVTPSGIQVGAQFYSTTNTETANSVDGLLKNATGAGNATNVDVQLLDSGSAPIVVASAKPGIGDTTGVTDGTTFTSSGTPLTAADVTLDYSAQYYATGAATAGDLSTTVTYQINYK